METLAANFLIEIYSNIDIFLLIMARILGFFIMMPIFAGQNIPMTSKVGLSIIFAYVVITSQTVIVEYPQTIFGFAMLLTKEFLVGFSISFVVYLIFSISYMIGQIIDLQIGFSMVNVFDPVSQIQVPITGNLLYMTMTAFLVVTGGLNTLIHTLFYSYKLIPVGEAIFLENPGLARLAIELITKYITLGVRFSLPILGTVIVLDIALGLLVKSVPQMNVFVVGMPFKLLIGLVILASISPIFFQVYEELYQEALRAISDVMGSMIP